MDIRHSAAVRFTACKMQHSSADASPEAARQLLTLIRLRCTPMLMVSQPQEAAYANTCAKPVQGTAHQHTRRQLCMAARDTGLLNQTDERTLR